MTARSPEALIATRRRDSTRRRQRVLDALDQLAAAGGEISVSAVARAAKVDRSFLYRHHDLRAQIHARAAASGTSPASTTVSRPSLLADLANLQEQNQRLRRQNHSLTARLSEILGAEVFRASGIGHPGETGQLKTRVAELEQTIFDLRQQVEERTDELDSTPPGKPTATSWPSPTGNPPAPDSAPHLSHNAVARKPAPDLGKQNLCVTCPICTPREPLSCAGPD